MEYRNTLHVADCLDILQRMPARTVQACYFDPPYNTGRSVSAEQGGYRDNWTYQDSPDAPQTCEWIEAVYGRTGTTGYLHYLATRMIEIRRVLTDTGSLFLHCDARSSSQLKVLLDNLFGKDNFRNLILWHYASSHPKVWPKRGFYSNTDHILFYAKDKDNLFNTLFKPLTHKQVIENYYHTAPDGRRYRNTGRFVRDVKREYADESPGTPLTDLWNIPIAKPLERTGYPTQKPLALLRRIVECSTNEGDLILDPFCGSGTTLLAAERLKRDYCGIDINPTAIATAEHRLAKPSIPWRTS